MSYNKNTAGQKFNVLAVNSATGLPVTGDAANITAQISLDSGAFAAIADTNPTELDATNAAGVYVFDLSQVETNGDVLTIVPSSATSNVQLDMLNIYTVVLSDYKADVSALATSASVAALNDFDPASDTVANVTLVATTTANTDMRGTDGANTVTPNTIAPANSDISAIKTKTDQFVFTVTNQVDANSLTGGTSPSAVADAVWDEAASGHNIGGSFGKFIRQMKEGLIVDEATVDDSSATTTSFITTLPKSVDDFYNDDTLVFISGDLTGQSRIVHEYDGGDLRVTFDEPLTSVPSDTDEFILLAGHNHSKTQIESTVWDAVATDHQIAGSTGKVLTDLPSVADIMASGDIDGYTLEEALKLCAAVLAGKVSGAGTTEITFRAVDDSKDRVVATVAGEGNRTSVTIDVTG
jgi:hypothetical protein